MFPAPFDYHRPASLTEAIALLAQHGENAKLLAGGHSLLPSMKLRLAQPKVLIDIGRIGDLDYIREQGGRIAIGAMATHHDIEASELLRAQCPLLPELAACIGDVQVRNRGTLGGSLAHADPAADWPAAVLALNAEIEVIGPQGSRVIPAAEFFLDLFQTALSPSEVLKEIRFPTTQKSAAYVKFAQKASGFAIAGVAAVVNAQGKNVAVGITGIGSKAYRAHGLEADLRGKALSDEAIQAASEKATDDIDALNDLHASAEYRLHLGRVLAKRALLLARDRG